METVTVQVPKERLGEFYALLSQFYSKESTWGGTSDHATTGVSVAETSVAHKPVRGRYAPLYRYFLEAEDDSVNLTFAEVEDILGAQLPASAREHRSVWANSEGSFLGRIWLRAGWHLERIDMRREEVRFERARA